MFWFPQVVYKQMLGEVGTWSWTIEQTVSQTDWNVNQMWFTRVILIKW